MTNTGTEPTLQANMDAFSGSDEDLTPFSTTPIKQSAATARNDLCLQLAIQHDSSLLSKYLPSDPAVFLPDPVPGFDDAFLPPPSFFSALQQVHVMDTPAPRASLVCFDTTTADFDHNTQLLKDSRLDFEVFVNKHLNTTLGYRSEFRPIQQLCLVSQGHPQ
jgi:hypothetical protein